MFTNICLLLIAFMLGLNVCFLFCIGKVLKDLVDKYHCSVPYDVWGEFVSPDMIRDLVDNLNFYFFSQNYGGDD